MRKRTRKEINRAVSKWLGNKEIAEDDYFVLCYGTDFLHNEESLGEILGYIEIPDEVYGSIMEMVESTNTASENDAYWLEPETFPKGKVGRILKPYESDDKDLRRSYRFRDKKELVDVIFRIYQETEWVEDIVGHAENLYGLSKLNPDEIYWKSETGDHQYRGGSESLCYYSTSTTYLVVDGERTPLRKLDGEFPQREWLSEEEKKEKEKEMKRKKEAERVAEEEKKKQEEEEKKKRWVTVKQDGNIRWRKKGESLRKEEYAQVVDKWLPQRPEGGEEERVRKELER